MKFKDNSQEIFLIYLDELDRKAYGKFQMTDIRDGFIFLQTPENTLMIPVNRVLKIKKSLKLEKENE